MNIKTMAIRSHYWYSILIPRRGLQKHIVPTVLIATLTLGFGPEACKDQFQVNPTVDHRDEEGALGGHPGYGGWVAVWEHWENGVAGSDVDGQRFDPTGAAQGSVFQVNTSSGRDGSPAVAMNSTGDFVVVWADDDSEEICARKYQADGTALTGELVVATSGDFIRTSPAVAIAAGGEFMVVWEERVVDPDEGALDSDIWARYYNASATGSGEIMVNITTVGNQNEPTIAALDGGGWMIAWESGNNVLGRRYTAAGSSVTSELTLNSHTTGAQTEPNLTELPGGGYAAVWRGPGFGADTDGIQLREYSAADAASGPEIQVNTFTTSWQGRPSVDADVGGDLIVVWESDGSPEGDADDSSIQGRMYYANGNPHLQQFQVNTTATGAQREPVVAFIYELGFPSVAAVALWTDYEEPDPETVTQDVQAKIYDISKVIFADDFETGDTSYW